LREHLHMIRLRQVALAAHRLDPVVEALCDTFGLSVCFRDPDVATFGLHNALMTVGDQFLEVVAPDPSLGPPENTTVHRLLTKRGGDSTDTVTGYMPIYEVDDLDAREKHLGDKGVRTVFRVDLPTVRGRHLHPADVGGALCSVDQPVPNGSWEYAGREWTAHSDTSVVTAIAGVTIGADDPEAMQSRWDDLGLCHSVRFQQAGGRREGMDELELVASDRSRVGQTTDIGGFVIRLV
jgi:hypothetical protein